VNGAGEGKILDIVVQENGSIYYVVLRDDGTAQSGIYPNEVTLIGRRAHK
jgi:hypothetical protein